jgi:hypothetical protein
MHMHMHMHMHTHMHTHMHMHMHMHIDADEIRWLGFTMLHDSRRYTIPRCLRPSHPDTKARCLASRCPLELPRPAPRPGRLADFFEQQWSQWWWLEIETSP